MTEAEKYADKKYTPQAKEYASTSSVRAVYDNCIVDFNAGYNLANIKIEEMAKRIEMLNNMNELLKRKIRRMEHFRAESDMDFGVGDLD
jgi:hypothetical protein